MMTLETGCVQTDYGPRPQQQNLPIPLVPSKYRTLSVLSYANVSRNDYGAGDINSYIESRLQSYAIAGGYKIVGGEAVRSQVTNEIKHDHSQLNREPTLDIGKQASARAQLIVRLTLTNSQIQPPPVPQINVNFGSYYRSRSNSYRPPPIIVKNVGVSAQMVDVEEGLIIWSHTYENGYQGSSDHEAVRNAIGEIMRFFPRVDQARLGELATP